MLGSFRNLEELSLRSITLPDRSILTSLDELRSLKLKLGGTNDQTLLPRIGKLEHLEIWQVRGLVVLSPIGDLERLRYLFLETLSRVEKLPDFGGTPEPERPHTEGLKGPTSITAIANAPNIRDLMLDVPQLRIDDIACLVDHPTISAASIGLGSVKRNDEAREVMGLPDVSDYKPAWRDVCDT